MKIIFYLIIIFQFKSIFVDSNPLNDEQNDIKQREKRWAYTEKIKLWPTENIYYKYNCSRYTPENLDIIKLSLQEIMAGTCLKFIEINNSSYERNFISIECIDYKACSSATGFKGGKQHMNLAIVYSDKPKLTCLEKRYVQHEMLHAIGFLHEHTAPNRDQYIQINNDNIIPEQVNFFNKDLPNKTSSYGCDFDLNSVMMIPKKKYAKNNSLVSVQLKKNPNEKFGIAKGVSKCDLIRINNMYCTNKSK